MKAACPLVVAALVALSGALASPARAACPSPNASYFGPCGPTFTTPMWGDAAGWTDPSKYSTIQLADVNGDGKDELLGRGDAGIEIWTFDTSVGQWRPQVDANAVRQVLPDFRSPGLRDDTLGWKQAQYYATIQTANVDGAPGEEVIARFPDGMRAYGYKPPAGGNDVDGGTWRLLASQGPYPDRWGWTDPQYYLTIRSLVAGGRSSLVSHQSPGLLAYSWADGWHYDSSTSALEGCSSSTVCATSVQVLPDGGRFSAADPATHFGRSIFTFQGPGKGWARMPVGLGGDYPSGPLSTDRGSGSDCPTGNTPCFPQAPALWDSVRWANLGLPQGGPALLALLPDGLLTVQVTPGDPSGTIGWRTVPSFPVLPYPRGEWTTNKALPASLTVANLDGQGPDELVALNGGQLQAYRYDTAQESWIQLKPTTPVTLDDPDVWQDPAHYGTFRAGDVDGDGREEIIARGPYGIRTWFYDRRGTGGWERYVPSGYPSFSAGQASAFTKLTELAKADNVIPPGASSVRDVWSAENPPAANDLTALQSGVLSIAGCSGLQPGQPPRYQTCTPPAGATFTAADWTAVINEVLAEIFAAGQVLAHFSDLDAMRQELFIAEGAEFPSIGSDLGLQAAANATVSFDRGDMWNSLLQIIGSVAGLALPEAGAALSIAGDIVSMVPSATPSITSTYNTTYAGLQRQFAESISDADKAAAELSQTVRQDYGLLTLVARLRERGTWRPDRIGVSSASNQAFAAWAYQSLLPAVYDLYHVTGCVPENSEFVYCDPPSSNATYPGVIGAANGPNFTALSAPFQKDWTGHQAVPCAAGFDTVTCNYATLPSDLANRVFGPVTGNCDYVPGESGTAWTFDCSLGLSEQTTVGPLGPSNGWNFTTYSGGPVCYCPGSSSAATRPQPVGRNARVRLTEIVRIPRDFRVSRARVVATRLLWEAPGRKELAGPAPFVSRPADRPRGKSSLRAPRARVRLQRLGPKRLLVDIRPRRRGLRVPQACHTLPLSLQARDSTARLETRLRINDGRGTTRRVIRRDWRCERDRSGDVVRLRAVRARTRHRLRHGLRSRLTLAGAARPGAMVRAAVRVRNARRRGTLFLITVTGSYFVGERAGLVAKGIRRLGAGRSKRLHLRLRVPRSAAGRLCVQTTTTADLTRDSTRRACIRIR